MTHEESMGQHFLKELEAEAPATRKCLEKMRVDLFGWKPHERSMTMQNLAFTVSEIPNWIAQMVTQPDINFESYKVTPPQTTDDLLNNFDKNMQAAREALQKVSDEDLKADFSLKDKERVLSTEPKVDSISSTINHLVHHRGQLTVYMRLNNIPVPSIYGPSADENVWAGEKGKEAASA